MSDTMNCKDCGVVGDDFGCPDVGSILCDDCYTVSRFVILEEQGLKDLFEVDDYLSKLRTGEGR